MRGQTKCGLKTSMMLNKNKELCTGPGGILRRRPGARRGEGVHRRAHGEHLVAGRLSMCYGDMGPSSCGPTTRRRSHRGPVQYGSGGSPRRGPWRSDPQLSKMTLGYGTSPL